MSLRSKNLKSGDLNGVILTFEQVGDILPMHEHTEDDIHITIVARGKVRIHGPTIGLWPSTRPNL